MLVFVSRFMESLSALSMPILLPMRSSFRQKSNTHGFLKSILYKFQDRVESYNNVLGSHLYSTEETELILYHEYEHLVKTFGKKSSFSYVFWIGDLNFRLDSETLKFEEVDLMVSKDELGKLLSFDQLARARKSGQAFSELNETLPTFPPSYKYKVGTSVYE